ncbi:MAG: Gfo/Idh/MocA family oxidoreductase [Bacillota bacterium]
MKAAIIGVGGPGPGSGGAHSIGRAHARAFRALGVDVWAAADLNESRLHQFGEEYGVSRLYKDYRQMLKEDSIDILSICTWPQTHASITLEAARAGVRAILCEKPMALSLRQAAQMVEACEQAGVILAVNHQRPFADPWKKVRDLIAEGVIGELKHVVSACGPWDIVTWGTHWIDMVSFFNGRSPVAWVLAALDYSSGRQHHGYPMEDSGVAHFHFENGVEHVLFTGHEVAPGYYHRVVGSEGIIKVEAPGDWSLRYGVVGRGWTSVPVEDTEQEAILRSVEAVVNALREGRQPPHSGRVALGVTQTLLAAVYSAKVHRRIDLPSKELFDFEIQTV